MSPELYNLEADPDESYDVAADHPEVVADILTRMLKQLPAFPQEVMDAWNATMSQKATNSDGGLPIAITSQ
jgi:hypothetical protein